MEREREREISNETENPISTLLPQKTETINDLKPFEKKKKERQEQVHGNKKDILMI
jgi:hypothetical protein